MTITQELVERVERASWPDRELDADIAVAVNAGCLEGARKERADDQVRSLGYVRHLFNGSRSVQEARRYTASLDAAMTLVPEGVRILTINEQNFDDQKPWVVRLGEGHAEFGRAKVWNAIAATLALAITAASLRARAAMEADRG